MKDIKFIKAKQIQHYAEIFQSINLKISFVNQKDNEFHQIFQGVKCRDFLGDCIWSKKTGNKAQIYSFGYNYKETPFDDDALKLSLTFPNEETKNNFITNFKYLTDKEIHEANVKESELYLTDDKDTIIIVADKVWQSCVWKISLFTFYLKLISYSDVQKPQKPEDYYLTVLTPEIEKKFLKQINNETEHTSNDIHMAHNYSGFVSIIKNQNKEMNKLLLET